MKRGSQNTRSTEHIDFKNRFALKLIADGSIVYSDVPQEYWSNEQSRIVKGKIDLVAVKDKSITAYELETVGLQEKSIAKLKAFDCNSAYIICHDGKSQRIK